MFSLSIADLIVLIHFVFILFVIFGGLLSIKWKKFIWLHLPAALWGVMIEFYGWICPLTILENELRRNSEGGTYSTSFVENYIVPIIYPEGLTQTIQIELGLVVIIINLMIYSISYKKYRS